MLAAACLSEEGGREERKSGLGAWAAASCAVSAHATVISLAMVSSTDSSFARGRHFEPGPHPLPRRLRGGPAHRAAKSRPSARQIKRFPDRWWLQGPDGKLEAEREVLQGLLNWLDVTPPFAALPANTSAPVIPSISLVSVASFFSRRDGLCPSCGVAVSRSFVAFCHAACQLPLSFLSCSHPRPCSCFRFLRSCLWVSYHINSPLLLLLLLLRPTYGSRPCLSSCSCSCSRPGLCLSLFSPGPCSRPPPPYARQCCSHPHLLHATIAPLRPFSPPCSCSPLPPPPPATSASPSPS